jgi:hypothetical protein
LTTALWHTPRSIAEERGIDVDVVLGWIRRGHLEAIDVSECGRRPRWRISPQSLAEFDRRRSSRGRLAPPLPQRRPRKAVEAPQWF